jgi:prepilin-type N-terminal cleavage/methylation domain-containing protein
MIPTTAHFQRLHVDSQGFSIVELLIAIIILPIVIGGATTAYNAVRQAYAISRQYNEIYAVLSACPELDRALEFNTLTSTNNCYPNNSFASENGSAATVTYVPSLAVTDTSNLPSTDPLQAIPDSKVVSISVGLHAPYASRPPLQLRMLITRNGLGQQ